ncbi:MAG: hypothetical protein ABI036_07915 [Fibrobacteria bacterium]
MAAILLDGCFASSDESNGNSADKSRTEIHGGWDDFPNKYGPTLQEMNSEVRQLPMPLSTYYGSPQPATQTGLKVPASSGPCTDDSTTFQYMNPVTGFYLNDTIMYYDSNGVADCAPPEGNRSLKRNTRRIVEPGVGEAWEIIEDSVSDQDVLPRHTIHSTGLIRLESGREIIIQSYDCTLLTPIGAEDAVVMSAGMKLLYKDGYVIHFDLAKPHPYRTFDFFPFEGPPDPSLIMSGPITHPGAGSGIDTVGYVDLFGDRTIRIRDWTCTPVGP